MSTPKTWRKRLLFKGLSLQQRLPLLICILLLSVIVAFSWTSYYGVKKAALEMGKQRLNALTDQLGSMFGQSASTITTSTLLSNSHGSLSQYLQSGKNGADTAVQNALKRMRPDSTWVLVELLDSNQNVLLQSGLPGVTIAINRKAAISVLSLKPGTSKIGRFYATGDSMYYPIVASIQEGKQQLGYLIRWRLQSGTPKSIAQLSQLLGSGATLYFGNRDGGFWTNTIKPVSAPPITMEKLTGIHEYTAATSKRVIATGRAIPNTEWVILVELSKTAVLETANRFLSWILLIGGLFIGVGIFVTWIMSRNLTKPLNKLTDASSKIASGNYAAFVEVNRRDEIGKLGRAFNAMSAKVANAQQNLEKKVQERTTELQAANKELEAFSYSVSHDLRAPLRAISGYAMILKEDYGDTLDAEANRLIDTLIFNAARMGQLIDDLINFSKVVKKVNTRQVVDMKSLADFCLSKSLEPLPANNYTLDIADLPPCYGDENLLRQVWMNLIGNAVKYSSNQAAPVIEIGYCEEGDFVRYYIKDNGVGFDMQYADKLFGVFQRLHAQEEFEGTGIGLALVKRIINKFNGEIWAEAVVNEGATFYFTLPGIEQSQEAEAGKIVQYES